MFGPLEVHYGKVNTNINLSCVGGCHDSLMSLGARHPKDKFPPKQIFPPKQLFIYMYYFVLFQVQSKVNLKYDSWHKEIVGRFGTLLGQNMQDFYTTISKVLISSCHYSNNSIQYMYVCCMYMYHVYYNRHGMIWRTIQSMLQVLQKPFSS